MKALLTFACVLRSGGDYQVFDAISLSRQVHRNLLYPHQFVCLSDIPINDPLITNVKLNQNWPGWWSVLEMFRLRGPVIATGLDTIIYGDISRLAELALTCPSDKFFMTRPQPRARKRGEKWCSGIMMWNGDWSWLYKGFKPRVHIPRFKKEQRYTTHQLTKYDSKKVLLLQNHFKGFYSYKNDCKKSIPDDAKVIAFHGRPRPKDCQEKWVHDIRDDLSIPEHPFENPFNHKGGQDER